MSAEEPPPKASLKRKLSDTDLEEPATKRQKLSADVIINKSVDHCPNEQKDEDTDASVCNVVVATDLHESNPKTESENDSIKQPNIKAKRRRFVDSDSDNAETSSSDDHPPMVTPSTTTITVNANTSSITITYALPAQAAPAAPPVASKFVYGDCISTVGHKIPETVQDMKQEASEEEEDQDDDLGGFVVADEDLDQDSEQEEEMHRKLYRRLNRSPSAQQDSDDSDGSVVDMTSNTNNTNNVNNNNNNTNNYRTDTPVLDMDDIAVDDDNDEDDDDDDEDEDSDIVDTSSTRRLRRHTNDSAQLCSSDNLEADEADSDACDDDDEAQHVIDLDIDSSDGEQSIDSIDDKVDRDLWGTDDVKFSALTFENVVRRQSLMDMMSLLRGGINIRKCSFWTDYPRFMKTFRSKATRALRLLSVLLPVGFANAAHFGGSAVALYEPQSHKLVKRRPGNDNVEVCVDLDFVRCMRSKEYAQIPFILEEGIDAHAVPKCFELLDRFRTAVVRQWFDAITFQDVDKVREYHNVYGVPVDIKIPRALVASLLQTDFEHLHGATGLVIAALAGALAVVKYFVEEGAQIDFATPFGGDTALMFAAKRGNISVVEFLCEHGADVNATTMQSEAYANTPVPVAFEALIHQQKEVLEYLAYQGADLYLCGPKNLSGLQVNVMALCLMEERFGMEDIRRGLANRFELVKECLERQFASDVDMMTSVGRIICDEFLNPTHDKYLMELKDVFQMHDDDDMDNDADESDEQEEHDI